LTIGENNQQQALARNKKKEGKKKDGRWEKGRSNEKPSPHDTSDNRRLNQKSGHRGGFSSKRDR